MKIPHTFQKTLLHHTGLVFVAYSSNLRLRRENCDEAIFARTAANCSFRNPVERMHAIANIGLQSIGMMRSAMDENEEKKIRKYNGNVEIRTACDTDENLLGPSTQV